LFPTDPQWQWPYPGQGFHLEEAVKDGQGEI